MCFPGDCDVRKALLGADTADTKRPVFSLVEANAAFPGVDLAAKTVYLEYGEAAALSLLPCPTNTTTEGCW